MIKLLAIIGILIFTSSIIHKLIANEKISSFTGIMGIILVAVALFKIIY